MQPITINITHVYAVNTCFSLNEHNETVFLKRIIQQIGVSFDFNVDSF